MLSPAKKIILFLFVIFIIFFQPLTINAIEEGITLKNEAINPGSFYYSFKRLLEKGLEKLQFSKESKLNFYQSQLQTRLAELNFVVEHKLLSEVQTSSERFAYQAGILTEELLRDKNGRDQTIKKFNQLSKFLEKLRDNYPANSSFWMLIQHDVNTLKILSEQLK